MATKPLQDDPSGPDTEYSENEAAEELQPVLVLRTARSLILPLRIPALWKQQPLAVPVPKRSTKTLPNVPFEATTHVLDPGTQRTHTLTLSIGPGIDDESVDISLQSDSIRNEGGWRAYLYRGTQLRDAVPFTDGHVELHRGLPAGMYTIKLTSADASVLPALTVALGPFNLPEALQAGETYLAQRQYIRAEAVLSDAAEHYLENADTQDLLMLAHTLAIADPAAYLKEESEFGVMRSRSDTAKQLRELLASTKAKFGKRMASIFAARSMDRTAIPDDVIAKIAQETASVVVLQVMGALKEHLATREDSSKDRALLDALNGVTKRLEQVEVLRRELSDRIELLRQDTLRSADEKFSLVQTDLQRYSYELARIRVTTTDYSPYFVEKLGQPCWDWIGTDAQEMFNTGEDLFHYFSSHPISAEPDFTPALLEFCRCLEMVLNYELKSPCLAIRDTVRPQVLVQKDIRTAMPQLDLNYALANCEKNMSIGQIASLMRIGKFVNRFRPTFFPAKAMSVLASPGWPADIVQFAVLNHIGSEFRNGKIHCQRDNPRIFTDRKEMQCARKFILGIDEEHVDLPTPLLKKIRHVEGLSDSEGKEVEKKLPEGWAGFPGLVTLLWQAFGQTQTTRSA
jgi:hypothetical protein